MKRCEVQCAVTSFVLVLYSLLVALQCTAVEVNQECWADQLQRDVSITAAEQAEGALLLVL